MRCWYEKKGMKPGPEAWACRLAAAAGQGAYFQLIIFAYLLKVS
jgi:hypothetical protein